MSSKPPKEQPCACVALLRGINVGGKNAVAMQALRGICEKMGWAKVGTYIQSGNVIFSSRLQVVTLEEELERSIQRRFGLAIPVVVRTAPDLAICAQGNPFPEASISEPNAVMVGFSKHPPQADAITKLRERAVNGETVAQVNGAIWIHFAKGVARSKLAPGLLDRLVGSPVTVRNWRTVLKIRDLLAECG